jgi:heme exporter protein D
MKEAVWLAIPLTVLAMGFLYNGWPSINIHKHYHNEEKKKVERKKVEKK